MEPIGVGIIALCVVVIVTVVIGGIGIAVWKSMHKNGKHHD